MRSLKLVGFAFAATVLVLPVAFGADEPEKASFDTVDGVTLEGRYYPSAKLKKAPAVMVVHKIEGNYKQDGYDKLAADLQKAGYAVLLFDLRGHGDSTTVEPTAFWADPTNRAMYNGSINPQKPPETITIKDFKQAYRQHLVNDLTAAKAYLDRKNDNGDCNSSNLIVIGAEDGATLGMMWMYSEQFRYICTRYIGPTLFDKEQTSTPSKQIMAGVWLSISPTIGNTSPPLKFWTKTVGQDKGVPMAYLFGEKSTADKTTAGTLLAEAKGKAGKEITGQWAVKGTDVKGHGLLSDKLNEKGEGRSWIVDKYLKKVLEEKGLTEWEKHEVKDTAYVWQFGANRPGILAKEPKSESLMRPLLMDYLKP